MDLRRCAAVALTLLATGCGSTDADSDTGPGVRVRPVSPEHDADCARVAALLARAKPLAAVPAARCPPIPRGVTGARALTLPKAGTVTTRPGDAEIALPDPTDDTVIVIADVTVALPEFRDAVTSALDAAGLTAGSSSSSRYDGKLAAFTVQFSGRSRAGSVVTLACDGRPQRVVVRQH